MDQNGKDDLKTQFVTREGTYRLITLSEYSRPNRVGYQSNQNNPQVRVSLLPAKPNTTTTTATSTTNDTGKSTFNVGSTVSSTISTNTTATNTATSNNTKYIPHQSSTTSSSNVAGASLSNGISDSVSVSQQQQQQQQLQQNLSDKICFNFGKELYVYSYRGVKKNVDLCKPIDKKLYKGTSPSCHDFNETTAVCDCAPLLVGFTTGQIQLVQPGKREAGRLYNEERLIDKTKVTCLKWLPKSPNLFLASHSSGHLYLYNEELPCSQAAPNYQNFKSGDGYTILTCKSKSTRNPLYKWTFNTENSSINEFCFSPCGSMLAIVSQDGFLRVFHYDTMELLGIARSYFGGFLCVCWSPDSKYVVVGGEDDLVTVWSLNERRVVARGQGHRSWVSVVAFDPYTSYSHCDSPDFSDDENPISCSDNKCSKQVQMNSGGGGGSGSGGGGGTSSSSLADNIPTTVNSQKSASTARNSYRDSITAAEKIGTSYRLGSVGQDTQLCLWDITEDILRQSYEKRHRVGSLEPQTADALSHSSKEIAAKASAANDIDSNSNSKLSNFRTKFGMSNSTDGGDTSSSSNNIGHTTTTPITTATAAASTTATTAAATTTTNNSETNKQKHSNSNSFSKLSSNYSKATNVMENCVNTTGNNLTKTDSTTTSTTTTTATAAAAAATTATSTGTRAGSGSGGTSNSGTSGSNEAKSNNGKSSESGLNPFNTLTQRLSNFNFVNDRKSSVGNQHSHKKTFTFSKSTGNHTTFLHHSANSSGLSFSGRNGNDSDHMISSSKNSKNSNNSTAVVSTYDPMKLIGSAACPRFDECPLLEPLVCKKIAHERLTALIFREDCFLTACQDGFIYTWARPGYSNIPQHNISNSPTGATSGTVV